MNVKRLVTPNDRVTHATCVIDALGYRENSWKLWFVQIVLIYFLHTLYLHISLFLSLSIFWLSVSLSLSFTHTYTQNISISHTHSHKFVKENKLLTQVQYCELNLWAQFLFTRCRHFPGIGRFRMESSQKFDPIHGRGGGRCRGCSGSGGCFRSAVLKRVENGNGTFDWRTGCPVWVERRVIVPVHPRWMRLRPDWRLQVEVIIVTFNKILDKKISGFWNCSIKNYQQGRTSYLYIANFFVK